MTCLPALHARSLRPSRRARRSGVAVTVGLALLAACTPPGDPGGAAEQISAAGDAAGLGFNSADQLARDADGTLHLVWLDGDRVVHGARNGAGEITTTTVATSDGRLEMPAIALGSAGVVVAWTDEDPVGHVWAAVSGDGGIHFDGAQRLGPGYSPSLASDGDSVAVTWHDDTDPTDGTSSEIRFARLGENGTFGASRRVDGSTGWPAWAAAALDGQSIWVVWEDDRGEPGPAGLWLRRSPDGGRSWLDEQELLPHVPGDPDVCVGGGSVWVGYHDRGQVHLLHSVDGGESFTAVEAATREGWFAALSCAADGSVVTAWERTAGAFDDDASKSAAYLSVTEEGSVVAEGAGQEGETTTPSILARGDGYAELVWIDTSTDAASPRGALWHQAVPVGEAG